MNDAPEQPKVVDDAQRAKSALADLELLPEDRAPLDAIVAAGYRRARALKAAASPQQGEG